MNLSIICHYEIIRLISRLFPGTFQACLVPLADNFKLICRIFFFFCDFKLVLLLSWNKCLKLVVILYLMDHHPLMRNIRSNGLYLGYFRLVKHRCFFSFSPVYTIRSHTLHSSTIQFLIQRAVEIIFLLFQRRCFEQWALQGRVRPCLRASQTACSVSEETCWTILRTWMTLKTWILSARKCKLVLHYFNT